LDGRKLVGYLELGEEVDSFVDRLRAQTGDHYAVLVDKNRLNRNEWQSLQAASHKQDHWDQLRDRVVVNFTTADPSMIQIADQLDLRTEGAGYLGQVELAGSLHAVGSFPLYDAAKTRVGAVLVAHDVSAARASIGTLRLQLTITLLILLVASCTALILFLDRFVFRRLDAMMLRMQDISLRLAGGDPSVGMEPPVEQPNAEIGRFEAFFGQFVRSLAHTLRMVAGGPASTFTECVGGSGETAPTQQPSTSEGEKCDTQ